jgi:hypothetical protein
MLLLFACAPKKPKAPGDLLNQNQMSDVLSEMHIADAIANGTKVGNQDSVNQAAINFNQYILTKHNISHEQFTESFNFYKQNPELMDSIYAEVLTKLSSREMLYRGK